MYVLHKFLYFWTHRKSFTLWRAKITCNLNLQSQWNGSLVFHVRQKKTRTEQNRRKIFQLHSSEDDKDIWHVKSVLEIETQSSWKGWWRRRSVNIEIHRIVIHVCGGGWWARIVVERSQKGWISLYVCYHPQRQIDSFAYLDSFTAMGPISFSSCG